MNTRLILLITILAAWSYSPVVAAKDKDKEECAEPAQICKALAWYVEAKNKHLQGDWRGAAMLAERAVLAEKVDGDLNYKVECISLEDEGYVSTLVIDLCDRFASYYPNGLLAQIKQAHPPQPYVFVTFKHQQNGWRVTDQQAAAAVANQLVVGNGGGSAMEAIKLLVTDSSGNRIEYDRARINATEHWTQQLNRPELTRNLTINLVEKDGFGVQ